VVVLEQFRRVGGKLLLGAVGDVEIDLGAESVLARRPEAVDLLEDVGLGPDVVHPATASAAVVRDGRLHPLPPGTVLGVPGRPEAVGGLLTAEEIERAAAEQARKLAEQAQAAAARRLLKAAALEAGQGQVALTRLRYAEAAGHYAAAAGAVPAAASPAPRRRGGRSGPGRRPAHRPAGRGRRRRAERP
jgi:oxygen-dependent protoporphyrinogen oxidase